MSDQHSAITVEVLREWTGQARVPGDLPEFSDLAGLLVAAGYVNPDGRRALVNRVSLELPVPYLPEGFSELRRTQRAIAVTARKADNPMLPGVVITVLRTRHATLVRHREAARRVIVGGKGVFANGARGAKRERREDIYLEVPEREELFAGLLCTPTPNATSAMRRVGSRTVDRLVGFFGTMAGRAGRVDNADWAGALAVDRIEPSPPRTVATPGQGYATFADGYETLLYLAGFYYDRIRTNPAWLSDHFDMQRGQVNLHAELADIAADVVALRALRVDLDAARGRAGNDASLIAHIDGREAELRPVWGQLLDRVQALIEIAGTVESAASELRLLHEVDRASSLDSRIDDLLARSGDRELSADHSRWVSQQLRAGEDQLRVYRDVVQGSIARIAPPPPRELPQSLDPE